MEWGQGERGAAGFEDHGGSELAFFGGQLLGGLESEPDAIGPAFEIDPACVDRVDRDLWAHFLGEFAGCHRDWLAWGEVYEGASGRSRLARAQVLEAIRFMPEHRQLCFLFSDGTETFAPLPEQLWHVTLEANADELLAMRAQAGGGMIALFRIRSRERLRREAANRETAAATPPPPAPGEPTALRKTG